MDFQKFLNIDHQINTMLRSGGLNGVRSPMIVNSFLYNEASELKSQIVYDAVCLGFVADGIFPINVILNDYNRSQSFNFRYITPDFIQKFDINQYEKLVVVMTINNTLYQSKTTFNNALSKLASEIKEYSEKNELYFEYDLNNENHTLTLSFNLNDLKITCFHILHFINAFRIIHFNKTEFLGGFSFNDYRRKHTEFLNTPFRFLKGIEDVLYLKVGSLGLNHHNNGPVHVLMHQVAYNVYKEYIEKNRVNDVEYQKEMKRKEKILEDLKKSKQYVSIRSRHPTHDALRKQVKTIVPIVFRLGSQKELNYSHYMINSPEAVHNASDKRLMKKLFTENNVSTADYIIPSNLQELEQFVDLYQDRKTARFIVKSPFSSKGKGLYLFNGKDEIINFFNDKTARNQSCYNYYVVEKFYNYSKEYRLHVTMDGCFYTCRKMVKADTPENDRWHRHNTNSVWIKEENVNFEKPGNWKELEEHAVKALKSVGLTIGAVDIICSKDRDSRASFIVCEINSAPSFGEITAIKYKEIITKIVEQININHK